MQEGFELCEITQCYPEESCGVWVRYSADVAEPIAFSKLVNRGGSLSIGYMTATINSLKRSFTYLEYRAVHLG